MAPAADDPFYNRKPVPDGFIKDIGETGLTPEQEYINRERKYSLASPDGGDIRKFSNPGGGKKRSSKDLDPFYQRKPVPDSVIKDVGVTGLSKGEEFWNRERKYSLADGSDARRFSKKNGLAPISDPHYGRRRISDAEIVGIGETGKSQAEEFEVRERKQSMFQSSSDPFAIVTNKGHRQSVSAQGAVEVAAAAYRRKSSALAPDAMRAAAGHHHSGYGGDKLEPIQSRADGQGDNSQLSTAAEGSTNGAHHIHHIEDYEDPDAVAPHEVR
jgi:hypothetical protein